MPWDQIDPVLIDHWKTGAPDIQKLKKQSLERVDASEGFQYIKQLEKTYQRQKEQSIISLKLSDFRKEQASNKEESGKLDSIAAKLPEIPVFSPDEANGFAPTDSVKKAVHQEWVKQVKKDFYIREAIEVIRDWK